MIDRPVPQPPKPEGSVDTVVIPVTPPRSWNRALPLGAGAVIGVTLLVMANQAEGFGGCGFLMLAGILAAGGVVLGGVLCLLPASRPVGLAVVWAAVGLGATFGGLLLLAMAAGG